MKGGSSESRRESEETGHPQAASLEASYRTFGRNWCETWGGE